MKKEIIIISLGLMVLALLIIIVRKDNVKIKFDVLKQLTTNSKLQTGIARISNTALVNIAIEQGKQVLTQKAMEDKLDVILSALYDKGIVQDLGEEKQVLHIAPTIETT